MKILLDESVPHVVQTRLRHLAIRTVQEYGVDWHKERGIASASGGRVRCVRDGGSTAGYQQNLSDRTLAIIALPTNQVRTVVSLLPAIEESLKRVQPGMFLKIPLPA